MYKTPRPSLQAVFHSEIMNNGMGDEHFSVDNLYAMNSARDLTYLFIRSDFTVISNALSLSRATSTIHNDRASVSLMSILQKKFWNDFEKKINSLRSLKIRFRLSGPR